MEMSMGTSELLNSEQVSVLLNQPKWAMGNYRPFLTDFPAPVAKDKQTLLYRRSDVEQWATGKDIKALFAAANKTRRNKRKAALSAAKDDTAIGPLDNQLCRQFVTGAFLPAKQRQELALRKLAARTTQPKTHRIQLVHDWMLEDGPRATYRR